MCIMEGVERGRGASGLDLIAISRLDWAEKWTAVSCFEVEIGWFV